MFAIEVHRFCPSKVSRYAVVCVLLVASFLLIPSSRRTSRRHRRPVKNIIGHEDVEKREGEDEEEEEEERVENKQQREKSRVDDLWESFKQDSAARLRKPYPVKNSDQTPSDTSKVRGAVCSKTHSPKMDR